MSVSEDWTWPFSHADLLAGLRSHLQDTSLQIEDIQPLTLPYRQPAIGALRGLLVTYSGEDLQGDIDLVLKEPSGTTRTGLAGVGRREVGFYRRLASQVPIQTPDLIAASPLGDWLLMERLHPLRGAEKWGSSSYLQAVDQLADLHNRFWNLAEDLEAFPWLGDPLASDFEVHQAAADKALERILEAAELEPMAGFPGRRWVLERLVSDTPRITEPLRHQPATLLHGDYWPGNMALISDDQLAVYDWQLAGIGPGILDLLVFIKKSAWWYGPLPLGVKELIDRYRSQLSIQGGIEWSEADWSLLWDHALLWRFIQEWLDLLAAIPLPVLATRAELLDEIWLQPVEDALIRRLGGA
jgi:thiamine kinase-like enzyme